LQLYGYHATPPKGLSLSFLKLGKQCAKKRLCLECVVSEVFTNQNKKRRTDHYYECQAVIPH